MSELDPTLQNLFDAAQPAPLTGEFVERVNVNINRLRSQILLAGILVGVIVIAALLTAVLAFPDPMRVSMEAVQAFLQTPVVKLPDSGLAWLIAPANNLAVLFVLVFKLFRHVTSASYGIGMAR